MSAWRRSWDDSAKPRTHRPRDTWASTVVVPPREPDGWPDRAELLSDLAAVGCTGDYADLLSTLSQSDDRRDLRAVIVRRLGDA